ncbi:hypothetical protein [Acinetobacter lanii]|nr:hypothetical protein [Acinetobacter lanii]
MLFKQKQLNWNNLHAVDQIAAFFYFPAMGFDINKPELLAF